ncbi:MAG: hypothetical protein GXP55_08095 [Deltaproteobacteria bacterium]|nr:hypothetical protein [Deltaproteobacteria bacterium]
MTCRNWFFTILAVSLLSACADGNTNPPPEDGGPDARDAGADTGADTGTDTGTDAGCVDNDDDGYGAGCALGPDCADDNNMVNPGASETCNGLDDDCNDMVDDALIAPVCELTEGVCAGAVSICNGADGWSVCGATEYGADYEATETACDTLDNDCDGSTDEADCPCAAGDTQPCGLDVGVCMPGTQTCGADGTFGTCEGSVTPMGESCNGLDDNCDGTVDEAAGLTTPDCPLQMGVCLGAKRECAGSAGWGACAGGASYGADYEEVETSCDGLDNDCDGIVDETCECLEGDTQPCGTDQGICVAGLQTCSGGAWGACVGETAAGTESCDGLDNDCDGTVDEGLVAPDCTLTVGVCAGSTQPCDGALGFKACTATDYGSSYQATESMCDGVDNDCNGVIDEGCACVDGTTQPCGSAVGTCERGIQTCATGAWGACTGAVGPGTETCNGLDDDCNGTTDDNLTAPSCGLVDGVCSGASKRCGAAAGWLDCAAPEYGPSYTAVEDGSVDELLCDGLDNDCDGTTDENCSSGPFYTQPQDLIQPWLYGEHLVFLANPDGNWDVFFVDLRTGSLKRLTTTPGDEDSPQVHGDLVVFLRGTGAAARAYVYNLTTDSETALTTSTTTGVRVNRGWVTYADTRAGNSNIYVYEVATATETPVLTSAAEETAPDLRMPRLAYVTDASGTRTIHMLDLATSTDTAVTASASGDQTVPRMDSTLFGWSDARAATAPIDSLSDWNVYGANYTDVTVETAIVTATGSQILGDVNGGLFAWSDHRDGNWDIALRGMAGTELFTARNAAAQLGPTIHANMVVWADNRLGTFDLYASSITRPPAGVGDVRINEFLADPGPTADVNGDGTVSSSQDEFIELRNITNVGLDISGFTLSDTVRVRHTFPAGTVLGTGDVIVVFGGGTPTGLFGGSALQTASTGTLGLNNGGDTITLADGTGTMIDSVVYGGATGLNGGNNESLVRVPESTGAFVLHSTDPLSGGAAQSPGTARNGIAF